MFDVSALELFVSPIQRLMMHNGVDDVNIYIKREDLLPFSFGGNKVRIAKEYFDDLNSQGKNCMIGYGNIRSNLCRTLANICKAHDTECHIISPLDDAQECQTTANSRLVCLCDAVIHTCTKDKVSQTIQSVLKDCESKRLKPYYINGNIYGIGNEAVPVRAYEKVYREIKQQAESLNMKFDYIFLATGTGATQSGLIAGKNLSNGSENIVGISISRSTSVCTSVIEKHLNAFSKQNPSCVVSEKDIIVCDDYLCDGYGKYNDAIIQLILKMYRETGIALDPVYSGKGFYGMLEYVKKTGIKNKNILFVHTGGTPLFFDFINKHISADSVKFCNDSQKLTAFLERIDCVLPVPLSARVSIPEYVKKTLDYGKVICIEENDEIVSAALFYCNDYTNHQAYLTLIATVPIKQKTGHAGRLLNMAEKIARESKMTSFHLDTEICNSKAISFYLKNNYKITYVADKIHMEKEL